jgi:hypothetical protein
MIECRFVPLKRWIGQRTPSYQQKRSPFRVGHLRMLDDLEVELRRISAKEICVEIDMESRDIRNDGWPRSNARAKTSAIILSFRVKDKSIAMPCDRFDSWEDNLRAIGKTLEALRAADRYGVTKGGEQYSGWSQLPPPSSQSTCEVELAKLAGVTVDELRRDPRAAYRKAVMIHHPDRGGDSQRFQQAHSCAVALGVA